MPDRFPCYGGTCGTSAPEFGYASFATSRNGTLVYFPGTGGSPGRTLLFGDRKGGARPTGAPSAPYDQAVASPDGTRLAVGLGGATEQIAILDLARPGATTRLTHEWDNLVPAWAPDGAHIAFTSNRGSGILNLYWQAIDGGGEAERLTTSAHGQVPFSWSPDGRRWPSWMRILRAAPTSGS